MISTNYFNELPDEILLGILAQCPLEAAPVCKRFSKNVPDALKFYQWNLLKNDQNLPANFRNKLLQVEESLQTKDGRRLISAFFRSLHKPQNSKPIKELDFSNLGHAMFAAWQADQDYNLIQCWSKIAPHLDLQVPLATAKEIRTWMNYEDNQNRLAQIQELNLSGLGLTILPPEIVYFSRTLTVLDLSHNQLTKLPDTIGNLVALTVVKRHQKLTPLRH